MSAWVRLTRPTRAQPAVAVQMAGCVHRAGAVWTAAGNRGDRCDGAGYGSAVPSAEHLLAFLLAGVILVAVPGPSVLFIVGRALAHGRRAALTSVAGNTTGVVLIVVAVALGVGAVAAASAAVFSVLKLAGAAYLIYLGVRTLLDRQTGPVHAPLPHEVRMSRIYRQGALVNVTNPKTALFFFAFLPQFVDPHGAAVPEQIVVLGITFALLGLVTDSLYGLVAGSAAGWMRGRTAVRSVQRWVTGCIFIGLGVATAVVGSEKR